MFSVWSTGVSDTSQQCTASSETAQTERVSARSTLSFYRDIYLCLHTVPEEWQVALKDILEVLRQARITYNIGPEDYNPLKYLSMNPLPSLCSGIDNPASWMYESKLEDFKNTTKLLHQCFSQTLLKEIEPIDEFLLPLTGDPPT